VFGDVDSSGNRLYEQASIRNANGINVEMNGLMNAFLPNTPIKIINSVSNFSITHGEESMPLRTEKQIFAGTLVNTTGSHTIRKQNMTNLTSVQVDKECWISGIKVYLDGVLTTGTINFRILKNGSSLKNNIYPDVFTRLVKSN